MSLGSYVSNHDEATTRSLQQQEDAARNVHEEREADNERAADYQRYAALLRGEVQVEERYGDQTHAFGTVAAILTSVQRWPQFQLGNTFADATRELADRYGWSACYRVLARELENAEDRR